MRNGKKKKKSFKMTLLTGATEILQGLENDGKCCRDYLVVRYALPSKKLFFFFSRAMGPKDNVAHLPGSKVQLF